MTTDDVVSRPRRAYRSIGRTEGARETRRRLVEAATTHFLAAGYAPTKLADVAKTAGFSHDTIYKTFGSKIALLKEVLDVAIGGDGEPVQVLQRSGPQALRDEADQRIQVAMLAAGVTRQLERIRPFDDLLRGAAVVDPEAAALRVDIQMRQRRTAMHTIVGWIAARGPLRDGLSVAQAAQVVWTLTSPEVHLLMRDAGGWSEQEYCAWLEQTLADGILVR